MIRQRQLVGDVDPDGIRHRIVVHGHTEAVRLIGVIDRQTKAVSEYLLQGPNPGCGVLAEQIDRTRQIGGDVKNIVNAQIDDWNVLVQETEGVELTEEIRNQTHALNDLSPGQIIEVEQCIRPDNLDLECVTDADATLPDIQDRQCQFDSRLHPRGQEGKSTGIELNVIDNEKSDRYAVSGITAVTEPNRTQEITDEPATFDAERTRCGSDKLKRSARSLLDRSGGQVQRFQLCRRHKRMGFQSGHGILHGRGSVVRQPGIDGSGDRRLNIGCQIRDGTVVRRIGSQNTNVQLHGNRFVAVQQIQDQQQTDIFG